MKTEVKFMTPEEKMRYLISTHNVFDNPELLKGGNDE